MPPSSATGVEAVEAPPVAPPARRHWRTDALVLAIATVVIRLPAFFAEKSLVFDDGVFASSARAMRNGELPFRDIFSSQGPVFLPLVWLADLAGFRTLDAPRLLAIAAGVLLTIAVYSCARHVTTRGNALLAAGLVTTSGSVLWVTVPVNADGPSLALSVLAIAFALRYREHPRVRTALWMGVAAGAAVSIKALCVPALVIAGLIVLLSNPRLRDGVRDAAASAGIALAVYVVTALPFGIADVWEQSYTYHQHARRAASHSGAFRKIVDTLWDRDKLVLVALALAAITWVVRYVVRRRAGTPGDRALSIVVGFLVLWVVMLVAVLGLAVVLGSRDSIRLVVMLVLLGFNVAAEMVSFSRVIDAVPPLRWFDRLGSRRAHQP
jgi:4-amino-4-deoxy-L-arabinose transferase-like glycosyltransferase